MQTNKSRIDNRIELLSVEASVPYLQRAEDAELQGAAHRAFSTRLLKGEGLVLQYVEKRREALLLILRGSALVRGTEVLAPSVVRIKNAQAGLCVQAQADTTLVLVSCADEREKAHVLIS